MALHRNNLGWVIVAGALTFGCSPDVPSTAQPGVPIPAAAVVPIPATVVPPRPVALTPRGRALKIEQLIGDADKNTRQPTRGMTLKRFGVGGADLGSPFEDGERVIFLFGDTIGKGNPPGADAIGFTTDRTPDDGVALDFFTRHRVGKGRALGKGKGKGKAQGKVRGRGRGAGAERYLTFSPRNASGKEQDLKGFEMPVAGIRLGSNAFVAYKDSHAGDEEGSADLDAPEANPTDITSLALFDPATGVATTLCALSRQPQGRFQKVSLHQAVGAAAWPDGGPFVVMHGTGKARTSHAYVALAPVATFGRCAGLRYFARLENGVPVWSPRESDAGPVFREGPGEGKIGELSVTWAAPIQRWIATYDAKAQSGARNVFLRHSETPWGPWSEPVVLVDGKTDVAGVFAHEPGRVPDDGLAGPMIGKNKRHPEKARGTAYAPFVVERWTRLEAGVLKIYYTLSLWNPYTVILMRSDLTVS